MLEPTDVLCPYCGTGFMTMVDCSAGDQEYIEDCQNCCSPINFALTVGPDGHIANLALSRDDE